VFSDGIVLVNRFLKFSSSTNFNGVFVAGKRILGSLGTEMAALIFPFEQLQEDEENSKPEALKEAIL
jgi:hypothetical protein